MVMLAEPLARTLDAITQAQASVEAEVQAETDSKKAPVIYLSPRGAPLTQQRVCELAQLPALTLLCGRYEGVDERLLQAEAAKQKLTVDELVAQQTKTTGGGAKED